MEKISSRFTLCHKRIFPIMWLSLAVILELVTIICVNKLQGSDQRTFFIMMPIFLFILGIFMFYKLLFCLFDEVYYDEQSLLMKNGAKEIRINFCDIKEINYLYSFIPRIEVVLNCETEFGKALYFSPPRRIFFPLIRHPDVVKFFENFTKYRYSSVLTN